MYIYTGPINLIFENIFSVIKKTVNTFSIFEKSFFKNKKLRAHINKIKFTKSDHTWYTRMSRLTQVLLTLKREPSFNETIHV